MIFNRDYITGDNLREERILLKKTQKEMAEIFYISRGTYSCWETRYKQKNLPKHIRDLVYNFLLAFKTAIKFKQSLEYIETEQKVIKKLLEPKKSLWQKILTFFQRWY